ncbi:cutinase-domain-containing protein [Xylariomycetidae sp. FL0641]|nr:cutinase-domain-containing protein [Xylariomycetidae sp. FL0641]
MILPLLIIALLWLGPAWALPTMTPHYHQRRQAWTQGWWSSEFYSYGCAPIIFVFAKATVEPGNLGATLGPRMSDGLKAAFGVRNVVTQGVDYWGFVETNYWPGGAPPWGIYDMQIFLSAAAACPNSKIVASGYSQGAALVHRAIEGLDQKVKDKIAGVVTFGDTQTWQDSGRIKGYPLNNTLIICNVGDVICTGTLWAYPVHFDYLKWIPTAVLFLTEKLLLANAVHPWTNGSFVYYNMTQPSRAPMPLGTFNVTWPPAGYPVPTISQSVGPSPTISSFPIGPSGIPSTITTASTSTASTSLPSKDTEFRKVGHTIRDGQKVHAGIHRHWHTTRDMADHDPGRELKPMLSSANREKPNL